MSKIIVIGYYSPLFVQGATTAMISSIGVLTYLFGWLMPPYQKIANKADNFTPAVLFEKAVASI